MSTALIPLSPPGESAGPLEIEKLAEMAVSTLPSECSRRVYRSKITAFLRSGNPLSREGVAAFVRSLRERGARPGTVNQTLSAIRCLIHECVVRKLLPRWEANAIRELKMDPVRGTRLGNWLTIAGAKALLSSPDRSTIAGCRDAALLSLLIGCGLRRAEAAELTWDKYQQREGRMCLVDIVGKGQKTRTIPVPSWAAADIDRWRSICDDLNAKHVP